MYSLYSVLLLLALVISTPWWLLEMLRHGKYRTGLSERLGTVPERLLSDRPADTIWIHAVSVGEVLAISRVVDELKTKLPDWRVVVSTTTDTGQGMARERFGENNVFYVPLDLPFAVRAYLQALHPKMLVLAESEFWPNLLHQARLSGAVVAVVNARVSDRSLPGYIRVHKLLCRVLQNVQLFVAQSDEDARRLVQMGALAERVQVSGNLKFEVKPPAKPELMSRFTAALERENIGPLLVAGSTLEGEEAMLLETFRKVAPQYPDALLVLAPRHPERFEAVASLLASSGTALSAALAMGRPEADRRRRLSARQHWRAGSPVRVCRPFVYWRKPGATRGTQRAGGGAVRDTDSRRSAHRKLPGHRRGLSPGRRAARRHPAIADRDHP